jgi:hypothetical protein
MFKFSTRAKIGDLPQEKVAEIIDAAVDYYLEEGLVSEEYGLPETFDYEFNMDFVKWEPNFFA